MTANRIPGGIMGKSTEFFKVSEGNREFAKLFYAGQTYDFTSIPTSRVVLLNKKFKTLKPDMQNAYRVLSNSNDVSPIEQMTMCLFGALNTEPDISEDGQFSEPEYVPCGKRKECKFQGLGCCNILISEGVFLSRAETEVFKLVWLPDQKIADKLFLSVLTVQKHFKNIRIKTGFTNKIEMAIWATKKGII